MNPTIKGPTGSGGGACSTLCAESGSWSFERDGSAPAVSSGRKRVYAGVFTPKGGSSQRACELVFERRALSEFGVEVGMLGRLTPLNVGPRLLATTTTGEGLPAIIESDAGVNLADELADGGILHVPGTPERDVENAKVMFDVCSQVMVAHEAGIYHRDLRCENVCLRRFGPRPQDLKATVIDFELGTDDVAADEPDARSEALYDALFVTIPKRLLGREAITPSAAALDLAYLAALYYHLDVGRLALEHPADEDLADFCAFVEDEVTWLDRGGKKRLATSLDAELDLVPFAEQAGLTPCDGRLSRRVSRAYIEQLHRTFLDAEDLRLAVRAGTGEIHGQAIGDGRRLVGSYALFCLIKEVVLVALCCYALGSFPERASSGFALICVLVLMSATAVVDIAVYLESSDVIWRRLSRSQKASQIVATLATGFLGAVAAFAILALATGEALGPIYLLLLSAAWSVFSLFDLLACE